MQALHGKQWPENTGKHLAFEGVTYEVSQDMIRHEERKSGRPSSSKSGASAGLFGGFKSIFTKASNEAVKSTKETVSMIQTTKVDEPLSGSNYKEPSIPIDVLFKKTLAQPHIYYLPLTDKQVQAKKSAIVVDAVTE
jgi:hypothetical protein